MLLRVSKTLVVNLRAYKNMQLLGPNERGLYFLQWERSGDESLTLEVAKDAEAAQKVFEQVLRSWGSEWGSRDWADLTKTLFREVKLPHPWRNFGVSVRDIEPRFMVHSLGDGVLFTTEQMRENLVAMRQTKRWPPNDNRLWAFHFESVEDEEVTDQPNGRQRKALIEALQAALEG